MLVIKNVSALHYCTIKMSERFYDGERERVRERGEGLYVDRRQKRNKPVH